MPRPTKPMLKLWAELWATPQAVAWEELGWTRVVARYVKLVLTAERGTSTAQLLGEVRQLEDRLGLNPMAMRRLYWLIEPAEAEEVQPAGVADLESYRDRLA